MTAQGSVRRSEGETLPAAFGFGSYVRGPMNRLEVTVWLAGWLRRTIRARDAALGAGRFGAEVRRLMRREDPGTPIPKASTALLVARVLSGRLCGEPDSLAVLAELDRRAYDTQKLLWLCSRDLPGGEKKNETRQKTA